MSSTHKAGATTGQHGYDWQSRMMAMHGVYSSTPYVPPEPIGYVRLVDADGKPGLRFAIKPVDTDWWDLATAHYPVVEKECQVPVLACRVQEGTVSFYPCTYVATEEYLQARWGRKLHSSDKDWLARHPLATDNGLGEREMPTALHQLLAPYGMALSRIRIRAGKLFRSEALWNWIDALGCNPIGLADRNTSNAAAASMLGMSIEQMDALFRFEYAETPLPCSVIGEKGWTNTQGAQVGMGGGHSVYLAPRMAARDWTISLQFAPVEYVSYNKPLDLPDYVPRRGDSSLILSSVLRPDGKPVALNRGGKYIAPEKDVVSPPSYHPPQYSPRTFALGDDNCFQCAQPLVSAEEQAWGVHHGCDRFQGPTVQTHCDCGILLCGADERKAGACTVCVRSKVSRKGKTLVPTWMKCIVCNVLFDPSPSAAYDVCDECVKPLWAGVTCPYACKTDFTVEIPIITNQEPEHKKELTFTCRTCEKEMLVDDAFGKAWLETAAYFYGVKDAPRPKRFFTTPPAVIDIGVH